MVKYIKNYSLFKESLEYNNRFNFNSIMIEILEMINDHRLSTEQVSKLLYVFNILDTAGHNGWGGFDGVLIDPELQNEVDDDEEVDFFYHSKKNHIPVGLLDLYNSFNDKLEHIDIDRLINILKNGQELSNLEILLLKPNKTFDDWVEIKTHKEYKYNDLYSSRMKVADHLLCTLGNGYDWNKQGYLEYSSEVIDWKNVKLPSTLLNRLIEILNIKEVKLTYKVFVDKMIDKDKDILKAKEEYNKYFGLSKPNSNKINYYPISVNSNIYVMADKDKQDRSGLYNFHESYIKAATEVCLDIYNNKDKSEDLPFIDPKANVEFAIKFLSFYNHPEFNKLLPKEIDKYRLKEEIGEVFYELMDGGTSAEVILDDSKTNDYGTNNYTIKVKYPDLKDGMSTNIEFLKNTKIYDILISSIDRLLTLEEVLDYTFVYDKNLIKIDIIVNPKYLEYIKGTKELYKYLEEKGFSIGLNNIELELDKLGYIIQSKLPKLGGDFIYSNAHIMNVYHNAKSPFPYKFNMDERNFNTIRIEMDGTSRKPDPIQEWIMNEHKAMKKSNPDYGNYENSETTSIGNMYVKNKIQGRKCLYTHDFMLWLKDNQENFKK
jgi:hypothetical protein